MFRSVFSELLKWKNSMGRKPLILKGARQVGKTWLIKELGKTYHNLAYFNFDEEPELTSVFQVNKDPHRIVERLSAIAGQKISAEKTLIAFDEVQECPAALNSLKYFREKAPEYHVVSAGSLLGTLLAEPKSYPVGMVNVIHVYPLDFGEFLKASDPPLYSYYESVEKGQLIEEIFHSRLLEAYSNYVIIGGMPECVGDWVIYRDFLKIANIQKELIEIYENDFSKHSGKINAGRILMVFRSIVPQLAKANEKFVYGVIKRGARAREFEDAIEWLVSAGIVNRIRNVSKIEYPLRAYEMLEHFKLFLSDIGLLKLMAGVDNRSVLLNSDYQFKGVLAENYVLQQLQGKLEVPPVYYSDKHSEIDFILQKGMDIIPVEVKAGEDRSAPSFKKYIKDNLPRCAVRFSKRSYKRDGGITNIPLYLAPRIIDLI